MQNHWSADGRSGCAGLPIEGRKCLRDMATEQVVVSAQRWEEQLPHWMQMVG